MARLFADENFPLPVVEELRRLGDEVVTINDTGKAGQSLTDEAVLDFAHADDRAVVTLNRKRSSRVSSFASTTLLAGENRPEMWREASSGSSSLMPDPDGR